MQRIKLLIAMLICMSLAACATTQGQQDESGKTRLNAKAAAINVQLGVAYLKKGNFERAKYKLRRALQQAPDSSEAHDAMAYLLEQTGEPQRAETLYRKAISLAPDTGGPHNDYGSFLCRAKRYDAAEKQFLRAVADEDYLKPYEAFENAGLCALSAKQPDKAVKYFQLAVLRSPDRRLSLWELSQLLVKRGEYRRAKIYIDRYLNIVKKSPRALALQLKINRRLTNVS